MRRSNIGYCTIAGAILIVLKLCGQGVRPAEIGGAYNLLMCIHLVSLVGIQYELWYRPIHIDIRSDTKY